MPLQVPALFQGIRRPPKTFLLHGPPGTGKVRSVTCGCVTWLLAASQPHATDFLPAALCRRCWWRRWLLRGS